MIPYKCSTPGRMLAAATAIALAGGGGATQLSSPSSYYVLGIFMMSAATLGILSLVFALEDYPQQAALAIICTPFALWVYALGLGVSMTYAPSVGYAFLAGSVVFAAAAIVPPGRGAPSSPDPEVPAHAAV